MGRWHRKPKKISLKPVIRDSDCAFVLAATSFTYEHLQLLRKTCETIVSPERIQAEASAQDHSRSVLIVAIDFKENAGVAILREGWRGVVAVDAKESIASVVSLLTHRARFNVYDRSCAVQTSGEVPPFVLCMNVIPANIQFPSVADEG
jgi:hypothetical protein